MFDLCTSVIGPNSFNQYQQRQQEAFQGIQNYFEQQRFLVQQQQMLQNLTECYSQMQQQHEDMLHLQRSFAQLFSLPPSERVQRRDPLINATTEPLNGQQRHTPKSFNFCPETSVKETPPPSPFTEQTASANRQSTLSGSDRLKTYDSGSSSGLRNRQFQFVGSTNPDTGVPSPQVDNKDYNQSNVPVQPVSVRVVRASERSPGNPSMSYNSVSGTGKRRSCDMVIL